MAMARLRGTNSVYVHAFGKSERGVLYLVMERLHGKNFEHFLRESEKLGGRLKAKKLMQLVTPGRDARWRRPTVTTSFTAT